MAASYTTFPCQFHKFRGNSSFVASLDLQIRDLATALQKGPCRCNVHLILINTRVTAKSKSQNVNTTPPPSPVSAESHLLLASTTIGYDDWSSSSRSRMPLVTRARIHILVGVGAGGSYYEVNIITYVLRVHDRSP